MTPQDAMSALNAAAEPARAADLATRFGDGDYLGVAPAALEEMARDWRQAVAFPERLDLARALWATGVFDAQLMAAKLLTQARIKDDAEIWTQICDWLEQAATWPIIDALSAAGGRRIAVDLSKMDKVHALVQSERGLDRRAALMLSMPLAKLAHPTDTEKLAIDDVLFWLTYALQDADKDVSRTAETWLKSLGKHDVKRAKMVRRVVQSRASDS